MTDELTPTGSETPADLAGLELSDEERQVLTKVTDVVRRIHFGTVLLVIQDGKVVQIEAAEKFRLR